MHHFFVEPQQIREREITILGGDVNHIRNVLRMEVSQEITVSNGVDQEEYRCRIASISEDRIVADILWAEEVGFELPSKIYLFQGLPKADKMELIIQKAVELGVYEVIPVATRRSVVKLDEKKAQNKLRRWNGISESAAKQSKRMVIPRVTQIRSFGQALEYAKGLDVKLIPYELAREMDRTRSVIAGIQKGQSIGIFIGPEGGFEEEEVAAAQEAGACPITLGKRILRTETAGMTLLSILMYHLES